MKVRCNAGTQTTSKIGYMGSSPEPIWHDSKGIANFMSLFVVQKIQTHNGNSFKVDLKNNNLTFTPTVNGLYVLVCTDDNENKWSMITWQDVLNMSTIMLSKHKESKIYSI
jgi:hypothetical protein